MGNKKKKIKFSCSNELHPFEIDIPIDDTDLRDALTKKCIDSSSKGPLKSPLSQKQVFPIDQKVYKKELLTFIDNYVNILNKNLDFNLSKDFKENCMKIYNDIINLIPDYPSKTKFELLYKHLKKGKGFKSKYAAAGLMYIGIIKQKNRILISKLAELFKLDRSTLGKIISALMNFIKKDSNYDFIFDYLSPGKLNRKEYEGLIQKYVNLYIDYLKINLPEINFSEYDKVRVIKLLTEAIESQIGDKYGNFFKKLKFKSGKILAASICLVYIRYFKDFDLDMKHFTKTLNVHKDIKLDASDLRRSYRQFITSFFSLDYSVYRTKVKEYLRKYLTTLKSWITQEIEDKFMKDHYLGMLDEELIENMMNLYDIAIQNGFQIKLISQNMISYFFPQTMALSLLFFNLKSREELEYLASADKFRKYFQSEESIKRASLRFDTIASNINNRLYPYIEDVVSGYKGQKYDRESFIQLIEDSLKKRDHPEIRFLLKLYNSTNFTPQEFSKRLGIYGGEAKQLIRYITRECRKFTKINTIKKIKEFIRNPDNKIKSEDQIELNSMIKEIQKLRFPTAGTRNSFISKLKDSLKNYYHIDTELLLMIYNSSDPNLEPTEFARRLDIYSGDISTLIHDVVERHSDFTIPDTFIKIENFILNPLNKISKEDQSEILSRLHRIQAIRRKDFKHRGVIYSFHWIRDRLENIKNLSLKQVLTQYLSEIEVGNFPQDLFRDPNNPRASDLKFVGTMDFPVKTELIEKFFKNKLVINATNKYNLSKFTGDIFKTYGIQKIGIVPDHPPILSGVLLNNNNVIAIEIPVWKKIKNEYRFFVGHIDLLLFIDDTIVIADYKPDEVEIFKSLPQIAAYGIMLAKRLGELGYRNEMNVKCVGFNKDVAWEFDPDIIKSEIPKFIEYEKKISKRKEPLMGVDKKKRLSDSVKRLALFT